MELKSPFKSTFMGAGGGVQVCRGKKREGEL